ncbi:hypothetical protein CYFUS_007485 [Cystobacter fuscus]|uniref:Uncharacterized protein n=1 Tax=Cystobacter fuscus TaxID=43 RepID=A0A250JDN3_9BACT|nr:hypothetical protein CYFUS_007485 [Cystobacter fuscus]
MTSHSSEACEWGTSSCISRASGQALECWSTPRLSAIAFVRQRLRALALREQHLTDAAQGIDELIGHLLPSRLREPQGPLVVLQRLARTAQGQEDPRHIHQAGGHVRVLGTEDLAADVQGALVGGQTPRVVAQVAIARAQGGIVDLLAQRHHLAEVLQSVGRLVLAHEDGAQGVGDEGLDARVPAHALQDGAGVLGPLPALLEVRLEHRRAHQPGRGRGDHLVVAARLRGPHRLTERGLRVLQVPELLLQGAAQLEHLGLQGAVAQRQGVVGERPGALQGRLELAAVEEGPGIGEPCPKPLHLVLGGRVIRRPDGSAQHLHVGATAEGWQYMSRLGRLIHQGGIRMGVDVGEGAQRLQPPLQTVHTKGEHLIGLRTAHARGLARLDMHGRPVARIGVQHSRGAGPGLVRIGIAGSLESLTESLLANVIPQPRQTPGTATTQGVGGQGAKQRRQHDQQGQHHHHGAGAQPDPMLLGRVLQRRDQLRHGGRTLLGSGLQPPQDGASHPLWHIGLSRRRIDLAIELGAGEFSDVGGAEGQLPVESLVKGHAEREHIAPGVGGFAQQLFGSHVRGSAHQRARHGEPTGPDSRRGGGWSRVHLVE